MDHSKKRSKSKGNSKLTTPATARKVVVKNGISTKPSKFNAIARGVGQAVGSVLGGPTIGKLAGDATSWLSKVMGYGTYKINKNTLLTNNQIPTFSTRGDRTIITNREFLFDVSSSTAFSNASYLINPGNSTVFPWLSRIAMNYEEFQFHGLIFEFKSTSATAVSSTNTALGSVIMAADYDVLDAQYADKRIMENTEYCTSDAPYNSFLHPIECMPGSNVFNKTFVTSASNISNVKGDPRMYFPCNFQLATSGMQAVSTIGELWVSYQVELVKPVLLSVDTPLVDTSIIQFNAYNGSITRQHTSNQNLEVQYQIFGTTSSDLRLSIQFPDSIPRGAFILTLVGQLGRDTVSHTPIPYSAGITYSDIQITSWPLPGLGFDATPTTETIQVTSSVIGNTNVHTGVCLVMKFQLLTRSSAFPPVIEIPLTQYNSTTIGYVMTLSRQSLLQVETGQLPEISISSSSSSSHNPGRYVPRTLTSESSSKREIIVDIPSNDTVTFTDNDTGTPQLVSPLGDDSYGQLVDDFLRPSRELSSEDKSAFLERLNKLKKKSVCQ